MDVSSYYMKRLWLWILDKIAVVAILVLCALYSLWDDDIWDDNGGYS